MVIELVISNGTRAARSFDFEITHMISDQIALHSVQLQIWGVRSMERGGGVVGWWVVSGSGKGVQNLMGL